MYRDVPQYGKGESAVFRMPGTGKCTNPRDASQWPGSHAWAGTPRCQNPSLWGTEKCPVHCEEYDSNALNKWAKFRELYATAEEYHAREAYMRAMLSEVTTENPPPLSSKKEPAKTENKWSAQVALLSACLGLWIGLAIVGLITLVTAL